MVLFGYTLNRQYHERIPFFPSEKTKIFCAKGDLVCEDTLFPTGPHFSYRDEAADEGPRFLMDKIG